MKTFLIKKGNHRSSGPTFGLSFGSSFTKEFSFDSSCLYKIDTEDRFDINKLFGVSTSSHHHTQSARVGWRCIDSATIELLTYCYDKGKRLKEQHLGTVKPNEKFIVSLKIKSDSFDFRFNNDDLIRHTITTKPWLLKYFLFPYFGGNLTAPHNITITSF